MKKITLTISLLLGFLFVHAQHLGDTLHVAHYDLNLDVMDFTNQTISGYADLTVVPKMDNLSQLSFDLEALTVDSVLVDGQAQSFSYNGHKIFIDYDSNMGDTTLVRIYYHGHPIADSRWGGFYFSGEYCYNMGVAFDAQPHNFGRCWYPCIDVFPDKSSYTMRIRTEGEKMAVCGGSLTDSLTMPDGSRIWTWQLDQPIPTYLASIAVGAYRLYADTFQGMERVVPIHIYAQPSTIDNVAGSFVHLKDALREFERLFGPYRWLRVGYVAVNFSMGAMEHATNIAYPNMFVNGNTSYETLYEHELFHHWFGNLITCNRAEEMWINEGFPSYAEALAEGANYGESAYWDYIRDFHRSTLKNIAENDGGHYALDAVPQEVTYGTHSYEKGALVIHSLRGYMGDSLFFSSLRSLLDHYAYQNVSSEQLFSYLSEASGMNLMDFYEGWVHQPGFLHFSIDSIVPLQGNEYRVYLHQKLHAATHFANSNRVDLTFVSADRSFYTVPNALFSGEFGTVDVTLPFAPIFGIVDYHEKLADATIDYTKSMVSGESFACTEAFCTVRLESFPDTVWVRVEHNLVSPDQPDQLPDGLYRMSDNHYWNVSMAYRQDVNTVPMGTLQFRFQCGMNTSLDYALMAGYSADNVKLLYRATPADPWQIVETTRSGSPVNGTLKTNMLAFGQYCLAVGDPMAGVEDRLLDESLRIYPNPAKDHIIITSDNDVRLQSVEIYTLNGVLVQRVESIKGNQSRVALKNVARGVYLVSITTDKGKVTREIVLQ